MRTKLIPTKLLEYEIYANRQTGKTTRMIDALPAQGKYYIVVWKLGSGLRDAIKERRGPTIAANAIFVSRSTAQKSIGRVDAPVFVDHIVLELMNLEYVKKLNNRYLRLSDPGKWDNEQ